MGQMKTPVDLYLRGMPTVGYTDVLTQLADQVGVSDRIHLLPSAPPSDMARLASNYDVGLSIELNQPLNRSICLTNKIFTYLLAGLPVILSKTTAQENLAKELNEAVILIDIDNSLGIAQSLDNFLSDPQKLFNAKAKVYKLVTERYNWDIEQQVFLKNIKKVLAI
jgi:glycosyltransferase involved in cell wall biosynthesis